MSGEKRRQRVRMRGGRTKVKTNPSSMKKRQIQNKSYEGNEYSYLCFFCCSNGVLETTLKKSTGLGQQEARLRHQLGLRATSSQSTTTTIVTIVIIVNTVNIVNIVSIANIVIIVTIVEIINIVYIVEKIL